MAPPIDPRSIGSRSVSPNDSSTVSDSARSERASPTDRGPTDNSPRQHAAHARQRPAASLAAQGQRSASPVGVTQNLEVANVPRALVAGPIPVGSLNRLLPANAAPALGDDEREIFVEDYEVLSRQMAAQINQLADENSQAPHLQHDPVEVAVSRFAPANDRALARIEAHEFTHNVMPPSLARWLEMDSIEPLRTLLAALPFSAQGRDVQTARTVFEQARGVMQYLAHPDNEELLVQCNAIAQSAVHAERIDSGFAQIRQTLLRKLNRNCDLAQLERKGPQWPIGLVHLQGRFGQRLRASETSTVPPAGERPWGHIYQSFSPAKLADLQEKLVERSQGNILAETPGSPVYGRDPVSTATDVAVDCWAKTYTDEQYLTAFLVAEEFLANTVPAPLEQLLAGDERSECLLSVLAGVPFTLVGNHLPAQHRAFLETRRMTEHISRLATTDQNAFARCIDIAADAEEGTERLTETLDTLRNHLLETGMPTAPLHYTYVSGEPQLFENVDFPEPPFMPLAPEATQAAAVAQALELWSERAPEVKTEHVQAFVDAVLPQALLHKLSALPNGVQLVALVAGLRMSAQRLEPLTLSLTTEHARQALADLQRFDDPHLTSLCIGIASEVACVDSLQLCFTQIRTALLNHAVSLGDGQPDSVFAALRPTFNQDLVEKMAIEYSKQEGRLPKEAVEYYVQLVGEIAKHVPLIESATTSAWGELPMYRIRAPELLATAASIAALIREKTTAQDPHFVDFFATHPAWQKVLQTRLYPDEYQALVARRDQISDAFSDLSLEAQASPAALASMNQGRSLLDDWFKAKTAPLLASLLKE